MPFDLNEFLLALLQVLGPFFLAGFAGLLSEKAGYLNIALEGFMLFGAFVSIAAIKLGTGLFGALLVPSLIAYCLGFFMAFLTLRWKGNIFILGLAMNLFLSGLVSFLGNLIFSTKSILSLPENFVFPNLRYWFTGFGLVLFVFFWLFLRNTVWGLRLEALSGHPAMLQARGVSVNSYRLQSLTLSGFFAALAGAALALPLGVFVPQQSAGKGWIALVLIYVGSRHPLGVLFACVLFGVSELLALSSQEVLRQPFLSIALPYLMVLVGLVIIQTIQLLRSRKARLTTL